MLRERGYRVRPAPSGPLALDAAESRNPDIILMDINMPEMDGYEACRVLKSRKRLHDIPVIFVSALGETVDKVRGFEAGGVDYVTKPVKIEEIEARVDTHVTIRRLRLELQKRFEDLCELEKHRDQLTQMIAHDLRNPLGVILGGVDFALQFSSDSLDENTAEALEAAYCAGQLINGMINDMLDVSRLETGKMPLKLQDADLVTVLDKVRENVVMDGRLLGLDLSDAPKTLRCDRELLRRVLTNLLGNAVKFTPSNGVIRISVKIFQNGTRFEVRDNGPGIPAEFHGKIFDKFGQVENSQSRKIASTGLGLTFCRLAIEAHGGQIGVDSEPGEGSTFWFTLPFDTELAIAA